MGPPRTCDRCYRIKAKCSYDGASAKCTRCARLNHVCEVKRAILQAGRPRKSPRNSPELSSVKPDAENSQGETVTDLSLMQQVLGRLKDFKQEDIILMEYAFHPTQVATLVYGTSFQDDLRREFLRQTILVTDVVKDGFLALAEVMFAKHTNNALTHVSHSRRSSNALCTLRNLRVKSLEDVRTVFGLALALITYNDLMIGSPMLPISRFALLQAEPHLSQLIGQTTQETSPHLICLLFNEVFECIALQQRPVFRFEPPQNNSIVDRYYGVCHELLPVMYDICLLYRAIKDNPLINVTAQTSKLAIQIDQWNPTDLVHQRQSVVPDDIERMHFLLQARAFKSACQLLLLQARRSSFNDMFARSKATQLQGELTEAIDLGVGRPKYLLFPYFLVCLELLDVQKDETTILSTMHDISNGMAPKSCESMVYLLTHISKNQQEHPTQTWFQCVDEGLSAAMGP